MNMVRYHMSAQEDKVVNGRREIAYEDAEFVDEITRYLRNTHQPLQHLLKESRWHIEVVFAPSADFLVKIHNT